MTDTTQSTTESPQTHDFQAEVSKILHLMVHSVYSEREVFLRELISNASDACDKLRYLSLTTPGLIEGEPQFQIQITVDKKNKTLRIADNGCGMNEAELIEHLGTIARSGTDQFAAQISGDAAKDTQLIGQFGVGFYSVFMVADRVDVVSAKPGPGDGEKAFIWSSEGGGSYSVAPAGDETALLLEGRGTVVTLHMRGDAEDFLDEYRLRSIIKSYSDHIAIPITIIDANADKKEGEDSETPPEPVNAVSALWTRPKSEITPEQYKEFYHHVGHVFDDPAITIHYTAEGRHEYTVLLFIPSTPPMDLFDPKRQTRVKLYVKRVFITDDAELLPGYLRFVRGLIDSQDMPLNISREMLQNNTIVASIRQAVAKRILSELKKSSEKDVPSYETFWEAFGPVLKEGIYEDFERRDDLINLARFRTTKSEGWRSLKEYVGTMVENQTAIYVLHGEDAKKIGSNPHLEGFRARGIEVLLLSDPVDAFWVQALGEYDGKPLTSVTQGAADLDAIPVSEKPSDEKPEETPLGDEALGSLTALMKEALGDDVEDVRASTRLTDSPVCLVANEGAPDLYMERILQAQGGAAPKSIHVLEINPSHALIKELAAKAEAGGASPDLENTARILLDQARLLEGSALPDPAAYAARVTEALLKSLTG